MTRKGYAKENELVHILWDAGFAALRAPSSGSSTPLPMPDIIAGNSRKYLAIEAKTTRSDYIYLEEEEVQNLITFAERFGATPVVGARFFRTDWVFFYPDQMHRTSTGRYKINRKDVGHGLSFEELVR